MVSHASVQRKSIPPALWISRVMAVIVGGLALFILSIGVLAVGYDVAYSGVIFPGVTISGIDLSGLTREQAAAILSQQITYPDTGKILLKDGEQSWVASPGVLGLRLDPQTSALAAYTVGRQGNFVVRLFNQFQSWFQGMNVPPLLVYDELVAQNYLQEIATQVDQPKLEASLSVNGTDVVAVPGQVGRTLDIPATLGLIEDQMSSLSDGIIELMISETPPFILDASEGAEQARKILSQPLFFGMPDAAEGDPGPWSIPPEQLALMLTIERVENGSDAGYQVALAEDALRQYLEHIAPELARSPSNARFIFNDDTRQLEVIQSAVIGRSLDVDATLKLTQETLLVGEQTDHRVPLQVVYIQPEVGDDATAESLGITQLVSAHTSYFRGSSAERIQNIQTAASKFHGILIEPGATFSMAEVMGDVSLDSGYAEALIIFGGRTIKGVGGGVCQVSTTLFRTVFFAGFPVVERYPHAYRVGYYEQTAGGWDSNLAGLDATVFVPMVDFKFTNDTPYWLLMETYVRPNQGTLTWKFYSTMDGRSVDWQTTGPQNIVEPPEPLYEENPELERGEIKQVDWAAEGADVTVTRMVYRNGEMLFSDTFVTHYMPWRDVFQYGPGTELPGESIKPKKRN